MFKNIKKALVTSFVGAIGLGWLFAQGVFHFAYIFSAPVTGWLARREYHALAQGASVSTAFSMQDALPELVRSLALLLLGYFLLRWLYFDPLKTEAKDAMTERSTQSTR